MKNPNATQSARKTPPREGAENTDGLPREGTFPLERGIAHVPGQRWSGGYGGEAAQAGPHSGKGPKGYKPADVRIHADVCDAIAHDGAIDATNVEVKVEDGIVMLTGTVGDAAAKAALEKLVASRADVNKVQCDVRVEGSA